jgi:subtilase family serine protease
VRPWSSKGLVWGVLFAAPVVLCDPASVAAAAGTPESEETLSIIAGSRPSAARPEFDRGAVEPDAPMERMTLALRLRPGAPDRLAALLARQQEPSSAQYHRWLTPEEFGREFGAPDADLALALAWLRERGFQVEAVARGRTWINFSGTVAQVERAFHTEIRLFEVEGRLHQSNATEIALPASIARIAHGVVSLSDFHSRSAYVRATTAASDSAEPVPLYTGFPCTHCLAPADFATIYNAGPLYAAGVTGQGVQIAIVSRTNIHPGDLPRFRSLFGLPANDARVIVNGADPGVVNPGEEIEAELDVEWTGAVAPGAQIDLVVSRDTPTSDGIYASAQYIVDRNLAPIVNVSFGLCEKFVGANPYDALWSQAAAQGQTVLVSSGDTGVAGCESSSAVTAVHGASVNAICSPIASTCVGGTELQDVADPAAYWAVGNDPATKRSALSYIPEEAWNEEGRSCGALCASGGGASMLFGKPPWQQGPGVPADDHRYVPDVALETSTRVPYLAIVNGSSALTAFGGTSLSAPGFSGIMALVVAKTGGPLGNANPRLYQLAAEQYGRGGPPIFHDATSGNNSVPGASGFASGPGYDAVTGLGSVDIDALAAHWPIPDAERLAPIAVPRQGGGQIPRVVPER